MVRSDGAAESRSKARRKRGVKKPATAGAGPGDVLRVRGTMCESCIYRPETPLDLAKLEREVADPAMKGHFHRWRICHHEHDVDAVCAGFYTQRGAACTPIQIAERLGRIEIVEDGETPTKGCST